MLAQYGYFYTQRFSNRREQRHVDTVPNTQYNDKPDFRARKKKIPVDFLYSVLEWFICLCCTNQLNKAETERVLNVSVS